MSYIEKTLLKDEKVLYFTKPHYIIFYQILVWLAVAIFASAFGFGKFITSVLLFVTLFSFITALIGYYCSEYTITNKRIVMKTGLIRRSSLEIFLNRLEGVYVDQSVTGRILNFGTVTIIGIGGTQNPFYYIPKPLKFRSAVQQEMEKTR